MSENAGKTSIAISGWGAVSPAGWGAGAFAEAISGIGAIPIEDFAREGRSQTLPARRVPKPSQPVAFLRDPRLRRASPVARFCVGAALEAIGEDRIESVKAGEFRLGMITCFVNGCVTYSHRFFNEVLGDPSLASPILFPETVYNAPSSHLGALLGCHEINYTLVGDSAQFAAGLETAARWLLDDLCDGVVVIGGEEFDWVTTEGFQLFEPDAVFGEGAGALYLELEDAPAIELAEITGPILYTNRCSKRDALRTAAESIQQGSLDDPTVFVRKNGCENFDAAETEVWKDWPCREISTSLGESMGAAVAWQCVAAADALAGGQCRNAIISAAGENEQAAVAVFARS